jgi:YbbR domain-containing protein
MTAEARRAPKSFWRGLTDNLGLKMIALALALLLSYLVHSDVDAQRAIYVDVVALLPPPGSGKTLITELPAQAKVTLRGSRSKLSSLSRDELGPIQLDLRDAKDGPFYLEAALVDAGSNVQVIEISPAVLQLSWVMESEKRVPVQLVTDGQPPKGRELPADVQIEPSMITIRGPVDRIAAIEVVMTEPLLLDRIELGEHNRRVSLHRPPEHVSYAEDTAVVVHFAVTPAVVEQTYRRMELAALGPGSFELRPNRVNVTLRGPQDLLDEIEADAIVPYVEIDPEHASGTRSYDVRLRGVPVSLSEVTILPSSVLARPKGRP